MPVEKPSLMFSARRRLFHRTRLQLLRRFRRGADAAGSFRCSARITPILFCNEQQRVHGGLPFFGIVFCLRQLGDVERGVAEGDQLAPAGQVDWIEKPLIPRSE